MDKVFQLKSGVVWLDMDAEFSYDLARWIQVADYINNVCKGVATITSTKGDTHSINSLHYLGKAIDIRISDWKHADGYDDDLSIYAKTIAWILGSKWLVVHETDHLHIQLGFSNIKNPHNIEKIGRGFYIV
jgi:hypothetical protein